MTSKGREIPAMRKSRTMSTVVVMDEGFSLIPNSGKKKPSKIAGAILRRNQLFFSVRARPSQYHEIS